MGKAVLHLHRLSWLSEEHQQVARASLGYTKEQFAELVSSQRAVLVYMPSGKPVHNCTTYITLHPKPGRWSFYHLLRCLVEMPQHVVEMTGNVALMAQQARRDLTEDRFNCKTTLLALADACEEAGLEAEADNIRGTVTYLSTQRDKAIRKSLGLPRLPAEG